MNAKKARPVDDPKALVPFGWAPGGYHCAACSTCGEAHSGSDKRSMCCQDCAEALRDKRANEPAPTTPESADHAELARAIERLLPITTRDTPDYAEVSFGECQAQAMTLEPDTWLALNQLPALLSEIAALRGEREGLIEAAAARNSLLEITERQRDELRKALQLAAERFEALRDLTDHVPHRIACSTWGDEARQANQGADQCS